MYDHENKVFHLATELINFTNQSVFLTGKAGTGKTTFLKYIREHTKKKNVVIAPTGVAAINAGGVTMHSFFQLPFSPYLPISTKGFQEHSSNIVDKHSLFKNIRFNKDKIDLLQKLELLIIDEISMVRCDMLDAIDVILRHFRNNYLTPFGGVQVLYIGDLFQLPPVVKNEEWYLLKEHYTSPFFFSAKVVENDLPVYIELKKIYRQSAQDFIHLLNHIRRNEVDSEDYETLNQRYQPQFNPEKDQHYITLTTHNHKADQINLKELEKLITPLYQFKGEISGEFGEKSCPADLLLQIKEGAQIMFIKNDSSPDKRYYNGKLAQVSKIEGDKITVRFEETSIDFELKKETWKNIRYSFNKSKNDIDEEELGSFTQFPIRLAWAVTIHKSQGLTFERAIIDAGDSFAPGQVYVALSRCTTLDGLILHSKITPQSISTDYQVLEFSQKEKKETEIERLIIQEKQHFINQQFLTIFNLTDLEKDFQSFKKEIENKAFKSPKNPFDLNNILIKPSVDLNKNSQKFQTQLQALFISIDQAENIIFFNERCSKAVNYFFNTIKNELLIPLQEHKKQIEKESKINKYIKRLLEIESTIVYHLIQFQQAAYNNKVFCENQNKEFYQSNNFDEIPQPKKGKVEKGATQKASLQLYKDGKTITEIATLRGMTESTIGGHLATFVESGEIPVTELISIDKLAQLLPVIKENENEGLTKLKELLGENFSYFEIKVVLHFKKKMDKSTTTLIN